MAALSDSRRNQIAVALLALMLTAFATIAFLSVRTKSPTADEPLHWIAGFMKVHYADFRIDAEDPPLAFYWAMIPHARGVLKPDLGVSTWPYVLEYPWGQWKWVNPTFFGTGGFDPDVYLNRSRAVMTLLGVMIGVLVAHWAWKIAGRVAAIIACGLFCFDPNFLGHSPLVKNDVLITLVLIGLTFAVYLAGQRVTIGRSIAIALLCAAALTTKFSGVIYVPIMMTMLLTRALLARPWTAFGHVITRRWQKFAVAIAMILFSAIVSYAGIWAAYRFRYSITPDPDVRANFSIILRAAARNELLIEDPDHPDDENRITERVKTPGLVPRFGMWLNDHRILPEAWCSGFLETYSTTLRRPSFLMGEHRSTGWWYYFPMAYLFKTPVATLALLLVAALMFRRGRRIDRWTTCCLAIPFAIYGLSALTTNLNLGLRHVFPIIPLMYIWAGATLANARAVLPRFIDVSTVILGAGVIVESVAAAPNYIAFFNLPSRWIGPINVLGDSNLDWGQDLLLLRDWQRRNPDVELILDYFGGCEPAYYVKHKGLIDPDNPAIAPAPGAIGRDGSAARKVLAVSASKLQGIYPPYSLWPFYDYIKRHRPIDVLGGTIYLYELPLRD